MSTQSRAGLKPDELRALPKVLLHEHLDCSLRPSTMLELFQESSWEVPANFPAHVRKLFEAGDCAAAASEYQHFLKTESSLSLANYVAAIVNHVLPLMQKGERLKRITRERIEDAESDGVVALELRFAPQLHCGNGLSLEQVMEAVVSGIEGAGIAVRLTICALRHEDASMAKRLADLAIAYRSVVGAYDLAGDEKAKPGVLLYWAKEAVRAREHGVQAEIHLWETNEPTDEDLDRLEEFGITRLGHGIRGNRQGNRILEVCPSSNVLTGQIQSLSEHPVDRLFKSGKKVTVNTDGTLFTGSDLSNEYMLLQNNFGWGPAEFLAVNLTALEASCFSTEIKNRLKILIENSYRI